MIKLLLITNEPEVAQLAESSGIDRIMVDLEQLGKVERQGRFNTVINSHSIEHVKDVKSALTKSELIVRVNPLNSNTADEVTMAVEYGADFLMLPMFTRADEVETFASIVDGRSKVILLVETIQAALRLPEIIETNGFDELYFGLNDLRISSGLDFLFESVSGRFIEHLGRLAAEAGVPWGFGGMARLGAGDLPADLILAEHARLGSQSVILSRAFHGNSQTIDDFLSNVDLKGEVEKIRKKEAELLKRDDEQVLADLKAMQTIVPSIARKIRNKDNEKH